jgi:hypothetical protein
MSDENQFVQKIDCDNADEFLDMLSLRGPLFREMETGGGSKRDQQVIVFRGHSDTKYKLIPSALRTDGRMLQFHYNYPETTADQIRVEAGLLRRFFSLADLAGLPLPEDSQTLRKFIAISSRYDYPDMLASSNTAWPPNELLSLIAIAQHYGLPTRLLDWTRSHLTAVYFAAIGALDDLKNMSEEDFLAFGEESRLSVWAFNYTGYLDHKFGDAFDRMIEFQLGTPSVVELVTVPRAGNPNLHAQDGILSLFRLNHITPHSEIDRRPLDVLVTEHADEPHHSPLFYEITLQKTLASQLMWHIGNEGINASRLYPGYGGVVKCLIEEENF